MLVPNILTVYIQLVAYSWHVNMILFVDINIFKLCTAIDNEWIIKLWSFWGTETMQSVQNAYF